MKNLKRKTVYLKFKVDMFQDETGVVITAYKKGLFSSIAVQGKSFKEAENHFWALAWDISKYHQKRSDELNCWKWFQKGDWKQPGGSRFIVFGIAVYFRYGKQMKGGWFVPFTNMNISIHSYWKQLRTDKS